MSPLVALSSKNLHKNAHISAPSLSIFTKFSTNDQIEENHQLMPCVCHIFDAAPSSGENSQKMVLEPVKKA